MHIASHTWGCSLLMRTRGAASQPKEAVNWILPKELGVCLPPDRSNLGALWPRHMAGRTPHGIAVAEPLPVLSAGGTRASGSLGPLRAHSSSPPCPHRHTRPLYGPRVLVKGIVGQDSGTPSPHCSLPGLSGDSRVPQPPYPGSFLSLHHSPLGLSTQPCPRCTQRSQGPLQCRASLWGSSLGCSWN